ncbi:hypothetical protein CEXT_339271 [Caerostris extrusa]|uniref:Uncharacterized protein n=1 Tax=Caerostris extrusa TaxID=172846 RepID=A0AAV4TLJ8_CAEEX|nr:hypothetical protein CEXT_339271 [Caerostris extrusa]
MANALHPESGLSEGRISKKGIVHISQEDGTFLGLKMLSALLLGESLLNAGFLCGGKQTRREARGEGEPKQGAECRGQTIRDIARDPDNELDRRHFPPPRSPAHNDSRRPFPPTLLVPQPHLSETRESILLPENPQPRTPKGKESSWDASRTQCGQGCAIQEESPDQIE